MVQLAGSNKFFLLNIISKNTDDIFFSQIWSFQTVSRKTGVFFTTGMFLVPDVIGGKSGENIVLYADRYSETNFFEIKLARLIFPCIIKCFHKSINLI